MRSWRGSRPKIASDKVTEPASLPSSVVIFISMLCALPGWSGGLGSSRRNGAARFAELAGLRRFLGKRLLHGIAHDDPAALGARHRALDHDQAAIDIGLHDAQIERGHFVDAHMAGHLLVLEGLAGILTAT